LPSDPSSAKQMLLEMANRFRIPLSENILLERLSTMLLAQEQTLNLDLVRTLFTQSDKLESYLVENKVTHHLEILKQVQEDLKLLAGYQDFLQHLIQAEGKATGHLQKKFHQLLWQWFEKKLVIIENYHASGNQVIETIGNATPPGFLNKIMGIQNIKGTGLDFVYCWQAWENCYKACQQLSSLSKTESTIGLRSLAAFHEHVLLTEETVRATVAKILDSAMSQNEFYHAELEVILATLEKQLEKLDTNNLQKVKINSWLSSLAAGIESFLDSGDAVKRRKIADQIYKDLADKRIAFERAASELRLLNNRQKGGWFRMKGNY
jgi:hypothetical protein